mgnify:CR=1 FL=1
MNSIRAFHADRFETIYVETEIFDHPRAKRILSHFPRAHVVLINRYMDVFGRPKQSYALQYRHQALILAAKKGEYLYAAAPVCQDFGHRFVVSNCVLNCLYDCDYCWLKGMFSCAHIVVFVNLEDYFTAVETELKKGAGYLSLTYQCDLVPLEPWIGYVEEWMRFASMHADLQLEIRTKCANSSPFTKAYAQSGTVAAYTLSPDSLIAFAEHGTPHLSPRLKAAQNCLQKGYPVRLCLDPMIHFPDWETIYTTMTEEILKTVDCTRIKDVSVGTFRISTVYLARIRRAFPDRACVQFPFQTTGGYAHYPQELVEKMENLVCSILERKIPRYKIFRERYSEHE